MARGDTLQQLADEEQEDHHGGLLAHHAEVTDKIARLTALRDELEAMVACDHRKVSKCRIIEGLADHVKSQHSEH